MVLLGRWQYCWTGGSIVGQAWQYSCDGAGVAVLLGRWLYCLAGVAILLGWGGRAGLAILLGRWLYCRAGVAILLGRGGNTVAMHSYSVLEECYANPDVALILEGTSYTSHTVNLRCITKLISLWL